MRVAEITTKTQVRHSSLTEATWSLDESVRALAKGHTDIRYLPREHLEEHLSERLGSGMDALRENRTLTIGQTLAMWLAGRLHEIDAEWLADEDMTYRAYAARKAAAYRKVVAQ